MCDIVGKMRLKEFIGYKVIRVIEGQYYSPAIGSRYAKKGRIKPMKHQDKRKKLTAFSNNILNQWNEMFEPDMKGRTAVFVSKRAALSRANSWAEGREEALGIKVFKVKITSDPNHPTESSRGPLLKGKYGWENKLVLGNYMEVLEEVV